MFNAEGTVMCRILDVVLAEPKFAEGANDFDICVQLEKADDPAQVDWWRGEVSQNYGRGNFATMKQAEITMQALRKIGFQGDDLTTLADQLVGVEVPATTKARQYEGKTYYYIKYIGGGGAAPVALDPSSIAARVAAQFGGGGAKPAPAAAPASAANPRAASSPF